MLPPLRAASTDTQQLVLSLEKNLRPPKSHPLCPRAEIAASPNAAPHANPSFTISENSVQ